MWRLARWLGVSSVGCVFKLGSVGMVVSQFNLQAENALQSTMLRILAAAGPPSEGKTSPYAPTVLRRDLQHPRV